MNIDKARKTVHIFLGFTFISYFIVVWSYYPVSEHVRPGIQIGSLMLLIALAATYKISLSTRSEFRSIVYSIGLPLWIGLFFAALSFNFLFSSPYEQAIVVKSKKKITGGEYWNVYLPQESKDVRLTLYMVDGSGNYPIDLTLRKGALGYYFGHWAK